MYVNMCVCMGDVVWLCNVHVCTLHVGTRVCVCVLGV